MSNPSFLTPVGRLVLGSLYEATEKDFEGNQLVSKDGSPRKKYFFGLAVPKEPGATSWVETEWGNLIYQTAATMHPQGVNSPTFSWKVSDGDDSQEWGPSGLKREPLNTREGYAGHWILHFASQFPPDLVERDSANRVVELTTPNAIYKGCYIQVHGNIANNKSLGKPGIILNHRVVCLVGYGQRIASVKDYDSIGFSTTLPAGATRTPAPAVELTAQGVKPATTVARPLPTPVVPRPQVAAQAPAVQRPAQMPGVTPYPQILKPKSITPPPKKSVVKTVTFHPEYNPEGNLSYADMIAAGWDDETLIENGLMTA